MNLHNIIKFCKKNRALLSFFLLLAIFIFFRFYKIVEFSNIGWDQTDSAWAARSILEVNPFRAEGVPIKGNTSMFMGPLYYYLITPVYFFTNLDMIASPIFAGIIAVINFLIFTVITKKLFGTLTAGIAAIIYTFSYPLILHDRTQAAFILIPILSYIIFFFTYKIIKGNEKYILFFAAAVGFGFHVHFTTVMYPFIFLLTVPFYPKTKKTLLYILLAIPVFLLFVSPIIYTTFFAKRSSAGSFTSYFNTFYHGFHLRRMMQINRDAFIGFQKVLQFPILQPLVYLIIPLFTVVYYRFGPKKNKFLLPYLMAIWIVVPWVLLSAYSGELTDYYFSAPIYVGVAAVSYMLAVLFSQKTILAKLAVSTLLICFVIYSIHLFLLIQPGNYLYVKTTVDKAISLRQKMPFKDRDPYYYRYYILTRTSKK